MKKNLNIATILLSLILVFTFFVANSDLSAATVRLISPTDFDQCIDKGDIIFQWEYNNLANANIESVSITIVNTNSKQEYVIPIDDTELTSFAINSEDLEFASTILHTWTVVAITDNEETITASTPNYFSINATPLYGEKSLEDNATCISVSAPIVFDWAVEDNYYFNYLVQISENESFEDSIIAQAINETSASATLLANKTYYWRLQDARCEDNVSATRTFTTELATATDLLPENFGTCADLFVENNINQIQLQWANPNTGSNYQYGLKIWNVTDTSDITLILADTIETTNHIFDITELYNQKLQWEVTIIDIDNDCNSQPTKESVFFTPLAVPIARQPANNATCVLLNSMFAWTDEEATALDSLAKNKIHYQFKVSENVDFPEDSTQIIDVTSPEKINNPNKTGFIQLDNPNTVYYWAMRKVEVLSSEEMEEESTIENYSQWTSTFTIRTAIATTDLISPADSLFGVNANLDLAWNSNPAASHYKLQIATDDEFEDIIIDTLITDITYSFEDIPTENQNYYWRVSCLNEDDNCESDFTTARLFSLQILSPITVSPAEGDTLGSNVVVLNWSKVVGANIYDIEYSTSRVAFEDRPDLIRSQNNIMDTTLRITMEVSTTYYWRVRAKRNQDIYSAWSAVSSFTSGNITPSVPALISPVHNQERVSRLSTFFWSSTSNTTSYELEMASFSDFAADKIVLRRTVADTTYTIKDSINATNGDTIKILSPNTRYYWRVRSINGNIIGNWSGIWGFTTFVDKPTTAVTLTSPLNNDTNVYADNATFRWEYHPQAQWYKVRLMDANKQVILDTNVIGTTIFKYTQFAPSTVYYWQVLPCNENGDGTTWSQEFMFKTKSGTGIIDNSIVSAINVYPNPITSNSVLNIGLLQASNINIKVYDINGNELQSFYTFASEGANIIEFTSILQNKYSLANGVYSLVVYSNGKLIGQANFVLN